jgi:perosamine synthetase
MKNTWRFGDQEFAYVREVLDSGFGSSTSGSMNSRFEEAFAECVGAKYAVTFNSGTGTLHAALDAVGVRAGDEVITTPLTVISNLDVIMAQNAIPVFADVEPDTFNLDPDAVARLITEKTKAIMPVSLYGVPCDLDAFNRIGAEHGIAVVHDAAQAHMAVYKGRPIAEIAAITSYSLENSKHITTGDGGIVVTDDEDYAQQMRKFGSLGYAALKASDGRIRNNKMIFQDPAYKRHDAYGCNYRMPEVAAALGLAQTERMDFFIDIRRQIADMYAEVVSGCDYLIPQAVPDGSTSVYWCYTVSLERSDITWYEFRDKFVELGGDGVYAAWALLYDETIFATGEWKRRAPLYYDHVNFDRASCPVANSVQPKLMQFVNNYGSMDEARLQVEALRATINFFANHGGG